MTNIIPDGGGNEIQVFVDNVRQQEGSSNAYTLGQDGSGDFKRITFTAAPAASQSIFVLNPGTKNVLQKTTVADNVITTAKVQDANITRAKLAADVIDATKLADDAVSEEHIDVTAITGHTELSETAADDDVLLIFDTSAAVKLKKFKDQKFHLVPFIYFYISYYVGETGTTLTITGTNFITGTTR